MVSHPKPGVGAIAESLIGPLSKAYKVGGFFLVFIVIGVALMIFGAYSETPGAKTVLDIGALVIVMCLLTFVYRQVRPRAADQEVAELRKFCERVEGEWWERVKMKEIPEEERKRSAISFFHIEAEAVLNSVRLHGDAFNKDGDGGIHWGSEFARVIPNARRIMYLWTGWHDDCPQVRFHGFGDITFDPVDTRKPFGAGSGRFWAVNEMNSETVPKSVEVRRADEDDVVAMTSQRSTTAQKGKMAIKKLAKW